MPIPSTPAALGLDFGTTNTVMAMRQAEGSVAPIAFMHQNERTQTLRSALAFRHHVTREAATLTIEAGPWAIEQFIEFPEECRFMQSMKTFAASPSFSGTYVFGKRYRFEDLLDALIGRCMAYAGASLAPLPARLVVGRPVHFAGAQPDAALAMQRYKAALARFGFAEILFVYEPVAAAFYYAHTLKTSATILVADFGGGTTDYSIMRFAAGGNALDATPLGYGGVGIAGDAFDYRIIDKVISPRIGKGSHYQSMGKVLELPGSLFTNFARWNLLSVFKSSHEFKEMKKLLRYCLEPEKLQLFIALVEEDQGYPLYKAVSEAKARLSTLEETELTFPALGGDFRATIRRADFEGWIADDLTRIETALNTTLARATLTEGKIDKVFLTGGTSFVPALRQLFERRFGAEKIESGDELLSIANGLALIGERSDAAAWTVTA